MSNIKNKIPISDQYTPKHTACAGCGMMVAAKLVLAAAGPNTIATNATGCSEVTTTQYPYTNFQIPWLHGLFENSSSLASGIIAAMKYKGLEDRANILVLGGDGATFDIGIGQISGMWERGENALYVCYDNEAYQNTGYQSSGSTPLYTHTTTSPAGEESMGSNLGKKDMIAIALAHGVRYVATASTGYPADITEKVKKALAIKGPKYLQIHCPCVPGWGIEPSQTLSVAQLAVQAGLYPIVEFIDGELQDVQKITNKISVEEYLKSQKRYRHLFKSKKAVKAIKDLQQIADKNINKYGLI